MKVHLDCFPCFLKQTLIAARLGTNDEARQAQILKEVLDVVGAADMSKPPAHATTFLHRRIRELLGKDPFKEIKSEYNRIALGLYPELKRMVGQSDDPLFTASRLAVAGNIIDFGIYTSVDIKGTVDKALNNPMSVDHFDAFSDAVDAAPEIMYLLDNSGEIVFDRLLIEVLVSMGKRVKAVVKGRPVLNDSTIFDAVETGLTGVCEVIDNGSDCIGTIPEFTSQEFNMEFDRSELVISKGQGNFESLYFLLKDARPRKEAFFLLQAKCDVLAAELGLPKGAMILMGL